MGAHAGNTGPGHEWSCHEVPAEKKPARPVLVVALLILLATSLFVIAENWPF